VAKASITILTSKKSMKVTGELICQRATEEKYMKMEQFMKDFINKVSGRANSKYYTLTVANISAS